MQQWFIATRMAAIPQTNQTRLMEAILDNTLYSRSMMKLREQEPLRNFFGAMAILKETGAQRDPQLYPRVVQAWDFLQKYVSDSDRLDWGTEAVCRASMRDIHAPAEDCGIGTAINSAKGWAALVVLMNMPEKKQKSLLKKMETLNSSAIHGNLCIPTMTMCTRSHTMKRPRISGVRA